MLQLGKYTITGGILAPMAGYTDVAFRQLCIECGAGLTVTEMVSVRGLVHDGEKTRKLMRLSPLESPSCVQLFGNDPDDFARVADTLDCDIIDINMGCPMPKITKNGDGSALLNDPELAGKIVAALKNATDKPITVKTRLGYNIGQNQAEALIQSVAEAGAAAVTVHGRHAEQRYTGTSDAEAVKRLAQSSPVPIIANGDLCEIRSAEPPIAAYMIGRQALRNPRIFTGGCPEPFKVARRHIELLTTYFDEYYTVIQARKFFVHYFHGMTGGKTLRTAVNYANNVSDILRALDSAERTEKIKHSNKEFNMENTIKAKIEFTDGNVINLELYPDVAPITVANFVKLCKAHFYDGLCFHRVIDKFMIQGGGFVWDETRGLVQKEAATIKGEFKSNGVNNPLSHTKGTISMARTNVKDSASSQFFICVADTPHLNGEYAAFGKCADEQSIAVAVKYGKSKTGRWQYYSDIPFTPIVIKTITVEN